MMNDDEFERALVVMRPGKYASIVAYTGTLADAAAFKKAVKKLGFLKLEKSYSKPNILIVGSDPEEKRIESAKKGGGLIWTEEEAQRQLLRPLPLFVERYRLHYGKRHLTKNQSYSPLVEWIGAPASAAEIGEAEDRLGIEFPEALRDFYLQANGIQMIGVWTQEPGLVGNFSEERLGERVMLSSHIDVEKTFGVGVPGTTFGAINVLPLSSLTLWGEVYGMAPPNDRFAKLILWDASYGYAPAFLEGSGSELRVVRVDGHGAGTIRRPTTVGEYLSGDLARRQGPTFWDQG